MAQTLLSVQRLGIAFPSHVPSLALPLSVAATKPLIPEVLEPDSALPADLVALRRFAYFMDEAIPIPGTGRRVGLDAGLGLIPGVGDAIGALLSCWIIIGAVRHRVPILRVTRMVFNVLLDLTVGSIPVLGDFFDFLFEENVMNLNSLLRYRDRSRPPRSLPSIAGAAAVIVLIILAVAILVIAGGISAIIWIAHQR